VPIENKTVSKALESAQKKVENHHFDSRKQVVQYDDVMNRHRTAVYKRRRQILMKDDVKDLVAELLSDQVTSVASDETLKPAAFVKEAGRIFPFDDDDLKKIGKMATEKRVKELQEAVDDLWKQREKEYGEATMRQLERQLYLQVLDTNWMQHLENMTHLREGIGWRSIGQRDPLVEYRREGQNFFETMQATVEEEVARAIFRLVPVQQEEAPETELTKAAKHSVEQGAKEGSAPKSKTDKKNAKSAVREAQPTQQHSANKRDQARKKKKANRKNRKKNRR
jgi:preprotein translocase subunit SecA